MEKFTQEALKEYLIEHNEEFRALAQKHAEYKRLIEAIEAKSHLTPEDELEEHRLKKLKLHVKDQMHQIMARYKASEVA
ncbi:MAG: YdcH family protein [Bryobacteraceae bacterium]